MTRTTYVIAVIDRTSVILRTTRGLTLVGFFLIRLREPSTDFAECLSSRALAGPFRGGL
jgi:hypothetical protein